MRKRFHLRGLFTAVVIGLLATGLSACEPASAERSSDQSSDTEATDSNPSDQEVPKKKPTSQPKRGQTSRPAKAAGPPMQPLPKLSGNAEKDKAAVQNALAELKTQWATNQRLLTSALEDKAKKRRVKPEHIKKLRANNTAFEKRAEEIYALLGALKKKKN